MTTGEDAPAGPQEPRRRGDGEVTDHPVTAPEPWPDWLADLTPDRRIGEILNAHAARVLGMTAQDAPYRLSFAEASGLLSRLLGEARRQAPVPSAEHSLAIAALTRLMLDEPLTELRDDDDRARLISRELTARMQYAAGTLETIRQLGQIPEQPEPLTHFTTAGQSRLAADNFPACKAQHWAIVSPYVRQVTCDDCLTWLGSAATDSGPGAASPEGKPPTGRRKPAMTETAQAPTPSEVLDIPMDENDSGATTIRGYVVALAAAVWEENEGFSGKRPFGNSGWDSDIHIALIKAGAVEGTIDEDGYLDSMSSEAEDKANAMVLEAIRSLATVPAAAE